MKKIAFVFLVIGSLAGTGCYYLIQSTLDLMEVGVKTEGTVVELEESVSRSDGKTSRVWYPIFQYHVSGRSLEHRGSTGSNPPSYQVGDKVELIVDPKDPKSFMINDFFGKYGGALIVGGFAGVFTLIGSALLFFGIRSSKRKAWLATNGQQIFAKVIEVGFNQSLTVNGRHPYQIVCQWHNPRDNKIYTFKSENLWVDPSEFVAAEMKVLIDQNNPKIYHMILEQIPMAA